MNPFEGYRVSSPFGSRTDPVTGEKSVFHTGIDLVKAYQAPIYAFTAGEVIHAKEGVTGSGFGGFGNVVAIRDANGHLHCYCHLYCCLVRVGDVVPQGTMIGCQGGKPGDQGAGKSTGSHLHYEVRKTSSPSFGWIADRANNCFEPTQYLVALYTKEGKKKMDKEIAEKIIAILQAQYGIVRDVAGAAAANQMEFGKLADAVRDAAGIPK